MGAVAKTKKAEKIDPKELRARTRVTYSNFRRSWVEYAKAVAEMKRSEAWSDLGYESFKQFCTTEFTDLAFSTITKLVAVVEDNWASALEAKLKKDPNAILPSYETCYQLTAAQEKLPKAEVPKLRKAVLDGVFKQTALREKVKGMGAIEDRPSKTAKTSVEKDVARSSEPITVADEVDDTDLLASRLTEYFEFIIEHIGSLTEVDELTEKIKLLGEKVSDASAPIDEFLDHVEALGE